MVQSPAKSAEQDFFSAFFFFLEKENFFFVSLLRSENRGDERWNFEISELLTVDLFLLGLPLRPCVWIQTLTRPRIS